MSEALKERKEMDPQYQWDLTKMYASDAEWEKAFAAIDPKIEALAAWEGKLNNAASIREFYDAEIGVFRELENLAVYTSLRLSEDTRADDAQSMDARATAKYVKAVGTIAYAQPEILALPQETLDAIMADEQVAPYRFALEDLLRAKPHTLTAPEEKLLAAFGEAFGTPKNVADNLADADMVFDSVKDGEGNDVELTASNYILLQTSNDRVLRKNAFESYYKSFRQHINTLAASFTPALSRPLPPKPPSVIMNLPAPCPWQGRTCPARSMITWWLLCASTCRICTAMLLCASASWVWTSCTTMMCTPR